MKFSLKHKSFGNKIYHPSMSTRNPNLLLIFDELAYQLMLYGRHPIDYMYDFNDEENPKITAAFERAFDLFFSPSRAPG